MTKPILFCDFDGTICYQRYWRSLPTELYEKVQNLLFRDDKTIVSAWMRGAYTAEEINQYVANGIGMPFDELWKTFEDDCKNMQVSKQTLEKLSSLREKYTVILTTVNTDSFSRYTVPALELEKYFDHISNSYFEKKLKTDTDGELFVEYAKKYDVSIEQCVVLDDSKEVCECFGRLGGKAYLVTKNLNVDQYLEQI